MAVDYRPKIILDPNGQPFSEQVIFWSARFSKEGGSNVTINAYAKAGLDETTAGWRIAQNTYDSQGDVIATKYADGRADFLHVYDNGDQVTITAATKANPAVITVDATAYAGGDADDIANGDIIEIDGVVGMTELNDKFYKVANWNSVAKTFELTDLDGNNINSTSYTTYTSGGEAHKRTYSNYTFS